MANAIMGVIRDDKSEDEKIARLTCKYRSLINQRNRTTDKDEQVSIDTKIKCSRFIHHRFSSALHATLHKYALQSMLMKNSVNMFAKDNEAATTNTMPSVDKNTDISKALKPLKEINTEILNSIPNINTKSKAMPNVGQNRDSIEAVTQGLK
jgi:hypothetical protein